MSQDIVKRFADFLEEDEKQNEVTPFEDNYVQAERPKNDFLDYVMRDLDTEDAQEENAMVNAEENFQPRRTNIPITARQPQTQMQANVQQQVEEKKSPLDRAPVEQTEVGEFDKSLEVVGEEVDPQSELEKALKAKEKARFWGPMIEGIAKALQAGSQMKSGVAGAVSAPVDLSFIQKAAEGRVEDIQQLEADKLQRALKDPNSTESIAAREQAKSLGLSVPATTSAANLRELMPQMVNMQLAREATKSREDMFKKRMDFDKQQKELDRATKFALKAMSKKDKEGKLKAPRTKGQEKVDTNFAKEYVNWIGGDKVTAETQLDKLKKARNKLRDASRSTVSTISGRVVGNLPKAMRSQESLAVQQDIESAVIGALRATLGAQFTEKEGQRVLSQSFDPMLSEKENLKKVDNIIRDLQNRYKQKADAVKYFENNETLTDYKHNRTVPKTFKKDSSQGPYGEYVERNNKRYRWNPLTNTYQISKD